MRENEAGGEESQRVLRERKRSPGCCPSPPPLSPPSPPPPTAPARPVLFWARDSVLAWDPSHDLQVDLTLQRAMPLTHVVTGTGLGVGWVLLWPWRPQPRQEAARLPYHTSLYRGTEAFSTRSAGNAGTPGAAWGFGVRVVFQHQQPILRHQLGVQ